MTAKIFISYRRDDSAGHAGRVHDRLEREFGRDLLFMDVDAVPLGMNFIKILREEVAKCDVFLAVIGPNWFNIKDKSGNRRIDDPHDYVRVEISSALQREIPVIPVLLDGAEVPTIEQLPKDLEELALRNGLYVRHASFHSDLDRLIAGLKGPLDRMLTRDAQSPSSQDHARETVTTHESGVGAPETAQRAPRDHASKLLWPALIFGSAVVLASAIFGMAFLKRPPVVPLHSPSAQSQPTSQALQQSPATAPPVPQTAQPQPAPVQPLLQVAQAASPKAPAPQIAQSPPASVQSSPQALQPAVVPLPSSERTLQSKDSFKDCETCPVMVVVPAGAFTMGSPENEQGRYPDESPQHVVTIKRPIAIGKFEVTVDEFAAFVNETGYDSGSKCLTLEDGKSEVRDGRSWRDPGYPQTGSYPVGCVNWSDAKAYLGWLTKKTGKGYRLLTEAEWEYAARATTTPGSTSRYTFGDDESAMCRYGNAADQTAIKKIPGAGTWTVFPCNDGYAYAAPVGTFAPNAFGLYDVHGNISEWTEDCYNNNYSGAPLDGSAWMGGDCDHRIVRAGTWGSSPRNVRLARRFMDRSDLRSQGIGFRVALPIGS
jgi:formylglycine-generating enzyme required for sulfatase activity